MSGPQKDPREAPPREATRLQSDEEIRRALLARRAARKPAPGGAPAVPEPAGDEDVVPYRPQQRPPMAVLCVLDDGKDDGEWYRLRGDRWVIGRTEGGGCLPDDLMMAGKHAEITPQQGNGVYRWH